MKLKSKLIAKLQTNGTRPLEGPTHATEREKGRWTAGKVGRLFRLAALAATLWVGWGQAARAQAYLMRGELSSFFVIPFLEVPDDPEVIVFADLLVEGQLVVSPSGTDRFNGSEVTAIQWSDVAGENFRYELVDIQMRITDGQNRHGRATGGAQLELTLVRIDPVTSQAVAILTGEGHIHFSADLETDRVVRVENVNWTVAPLP